MNSLNLHIVSYTTNGKKRAAILITLAVLGLGLTFLVGILLKNIWISMAIFVLFMIIASRFSKRNNTIERIGTFEANDQSITLRKNEMSRTIEMSTINSIHISKGVKVDPELYINNKSLMINLTLEDGEQVLIHVEVEGMDTYLRYVG